jgi:ethanolamine ammonia-lyase small subunit
LTRARIGLGRAGDALPTAVLLDLREAHAAARDAVHAELDRDLLRARLPGLPVVEVDSAAPDRTTYLQRPDLGRRLAAGTSLPAGPCDLAVVVADGLSARAVHDHAPGLLLALLERVPDLRVGPVVLAAQARVALGDEVGAALGARAVLVLVGERPGLSAPDSLGAYLTYRPRAGRRDSERNCVSNVRPPHGQGYPQGARTLELLLREALRRGLTGVDLKDDFAALGPGGGAALEG